MKQKEKFEALAGVSCGGIHSGIKGKKKDLGFVYVPHAVASAGVFTQNLCCASSVTFTKKNVENNVIKAVIVNSGCANASTGKVGAQNTETMACEVARHLHIEKGEVAVASTGLIGSGLPMEKIVHGIELLLKDVDQQEEEHFAESILTTDTSTKEVTVEGKIEEHVVKVTGVAKGSGMIAPNMATMLAFLTTNINVDSSALQTYLFQSVEKSFNRITVDSDTSTNDMVLLQATGAVNIKNSAQEKIFQELLTQACQSLAKQIVKDGEGATKFVEVEVVHALSEEDAKKITLNVLNSPLVKTALYGEDPNWGRILMAVGKDSTVLVKQEELTMSLCGQIIYAHGEGAHYDEKLMRERLKEREIAIVIDLNLGKKCDKGWGCDLTHGYVDINTEYN